MKRTSIICTVLLFGSLIAGSSAAQLDPAAINKLRAESEASHKTEVETLLAMTPAEQAKFEPLYAEYRKQLKDRVDEQISLITELVNTYSDISDKRAQEIIKRFIYIDARKASLRETFGNQFSQVLAPRKAAKYYVVEGMLDSAVTEQISELIRQAVTPAAATPAQ